MSFVNFNTIWVWLLLFILWSSWFVNVLITGYKFYKLQKSIKFLKKVKNSNYLNSYITTFIYTSATFFICFLLTIMSFRPTLGREKTPLSTSNLDIIFAVDISPSMAAEDHFGNSRLEGVKKFLTDFLRQSSNHRYSLITFSHTANVDVPLTTDKETLLTGVDTLNTLNALRAKGSSIESALNLSHEKMFDENDPESQNRGKIIFLFSDGEKVGEDKESTEALKKVVDSGIQIYTFGAGSIQGDKIPTYEGLNGRKIYLSYKGTEVITKLDEKSLQNIATTGDGQYYFLSNNFDFSKLNNTIEQNATFAETSNGTNIYKDVYFLFTPVILIIFILLTSEIYNFSIRIKKNN